MTGVGEPRTIERTAPETGADGGSGDEFCPAELLCLRHPGSSVAFTLVDASGGADADLAVRALTYQDLRTRAASIAAMLTARGVRRGDPVGVLMGKSVELPSLLLGIAWVGAVYVPLFTAFARPAIDLRMAGSGARLLIVDADQAHKVFASDEQNPCWDVVQVGGERAGTAGPPLLDELLAEAAGSDAPEPATLGPDDPMVLLFTSGTTGAPKGVPVPVRALESIRRYLLDGIDLRASDVYWNIADPGWAYGLYYGLIGPMALGIPNLLVPGAFSAPVVWRVLGELGVTNFAAAPTVYRAMRTTEPAHPITLRCASSAGEPLTPDVVAWSRDHLGAVVRDHYGQTELGMVVANAWRPDLRDAEVPTGCMGRPMPGWSCGILAEGADELAPAGTVGRLAIDTEHSPLFWFPGYLAAPERTAERITADGRWYLTGDNARVDDDGRLFFSARDDDVIIMAGYRIGPFDVESVLVEHDDVVEAAVIGAPDELRGEVIEAFVVLRAGRTASAELTASLQDLVRTRFAAHAYPRAVHVVDELPKTPSGKVQRFELRKRRSIRS